MLQPLNQLFPELVISRDQIVWPSAQKEASSLALALEFGKARIPHLVSRRLPFIKEFIIAPLLCHALLEFPSIALWSHSVEISINNRLVYPHYLFSCAGAPPNYDTLQVPVFLLTQVAEQSEIEAWKEVIWLMRALQEMNSPAKACVYAFLTNGWEWELAKLDGEHLIFHATQFSIAQPGLLLGCFFQLLEQYRRYLPPRPGEWDNPFILQLPES